MAITKNRSGTITVNLIDKSSTNTASSEDLKVSVAKLRVRTSDRDVYWSGATTYSPTKSQVAWMKETHDIDTIEDLVLVTKAVGAKDLGAKLHAVSGRCRNGKNATAAALRELLKEFPVEDGVVSKRHYITVLGNTTIVVPFNVGKIDKSAVDNAARAVLAEHLLPALRVEIVRQKEERVAKLEKALASQRQELSELQESTDG